MMNTTASPTYLEDLPVPERFENEEQLEDYLATPTRDLARDLARVDGDLLVLGVGGKMGPSLARLARNAMPANRTVTAVARFSEPGVREMLESHGVKTIACDLLDPAAVAALPRCPNVVARTWCSWPAASSAPTRTCR
jgi:hypothetical protein